VYKRQSHSYVKLLQNSTVIRQINANFVLKVTLMYKFLLVLSFSCLAILGISQTPGFPDDGEQPCGPPFGVPCPIPIDGGVGLLIAAGLVYGGKKFKDSKTEK